MTNILVTGGAGFIGSHVVDSLIKQEFSVRVLDNLKTGKRENVNTNAELIVGDITNEDDVKKSLKDIDIVCHFAAQASVAISMSNPIFDAQVNTIGTLNILKQCYDTSQVKHFIFASTGGAIYGDPQYLPVNEKHSENPVSIYGTSKLAAEKYIKFYQNLGLKNTIFRLANIYGPRQDPNGEAGVISIFLGNILNGKPLTVFGDGSSSRDYVFVKDVAEIASKIIDQPLNQSINVATGKETYLNELIDVLKEVTSVEFSVNYTTERQGDVKNIVLDNSNLKNTLNWVPHTSLNNGMKSVWDWMKANS